MSEVFEFPKRIRFKIMICLPDIQVIIKMIQNSPTPEHIYEYLINYLILDNYEFFVANLIILNEDCFGLHWMEWKDSLHIKTRY